MKTLKRVRLYLAVLFLIFASLLFLDFTGTIHNVLGFVAKVQFLPALLSFNAFIIILLVLLTLIFGRIYCSIICPLGLFQDFIARFNTKRNKYKLTNEYKLLRYGVLCFFVMALVVGLSWVVAFLDPYAIFGRTTVSFLAPIYALINNILAYASSQLDSYAFYETDVWVRSFAVLGVSGVVIGVISYFAYKQGRIYCNAICPVGTILSFLSRFSYFKVRFDENICNGCGTCAKRCKSGCIDTKNKTIDYSRCVSCFNCGVACKQGGMKYEPKISQNEDKQYRNNLLALGSLFLGSVSSLRAENSIKLDGGVAEIKEKKSPKREYKILPAGSQNHILFSKKCTACGLCIGVCPNNVLRPDVTNAMQPFMSYERGYCRPECTKCTEVCPTGAIRRVSIEEKSSIQIGRAIFVEDECITVEKGVKCGNCARHCPSEAITLIDKLQNNKTIKIPHVNTEKCIGCGTCEYLCPTRPFSAIRVEGNMSHRVL